MYAMTKSPIVCSRGKLLETVFDASSARFNSLHKEVEVYGPFPIIMTKKWLGASRYSMILETSEVA